MENTTHARDLEREIPTTIVPGKDQPPTLVSRWLSNLVAAISGVGLLALMAVMAGDVIGRYFFKHPLPGAYELVEYLMAIFVPCCVAYSAERKCHVGVDILVERLAPRTRLLVDIVTQAITIILVCVVVRQGWIGFIEALSSTMKSAVLQIPNAPFLLAVPVGFSAFAFFLFIHLLQSIREVVRP
jgi:TRAP-type C4-dicarboxylate transport system permease small subunit